MTDSTQKRDIKDVKEVVLFGHSIIKAGRDIFGGGFRPDQLGSLLPVYQTAIPAFENIGDVIPEIQDLDAEEIAELSSVVIAGGAIPEEAGRIVAKSLKVGVAVYELIKEIKN